MWRRVCLRLIVISGFLYLAGCGGGGSSNSNTSGGTAAPATGASDGAASAPVGASAPAGASGGAASTPVLAAATPVIDGTPLGTAHWSAGATASGGTGQAVGGLNCTLTGGAYTYSHLSIYQDGQLLALPANVGAIAPTLAAQTGCVYPVHTLDSSGKIRMDASTNTSYTLGQFFAVWGQPLTSTNVAGVTGTQVTAYVTSGGVLTQYTGDLSSLVLPTHGEVTIMIGTPLTQIPTYTWTDPPPFDNNRHALTFGTSIGTSFWPNGSTATGGTGQPIGDVICAAGMVESYHVHAHLAIFKDGEWLALPANIGITPRCNYETHTHDSTGVIHIETPNLKAFTLGKFFALWGEPLASTNVAGVMGPVVAYINDNGDVRRWMGPLSDIELTSHRSVTLQVGTTPVSTLATYNWDEPK